jgi:hypothetical protein
MEKYQRGKVYAIICRKTERRYIGSTCEPTLARRLAEHVQKFKKWEKGERHYTTSYDIIKDGDYYIVLLESYPCNSKDELRMCEQKHIDLCECVNKVKAFQSKEERKQYVKQYIEQNRDKIAERTKSYNKQYREQNHDEILEYKKQYNEQNRDEINAKAREKVSCPQCQKELVRASLTRHLKICIKPL